MTLVDPDVRDPPLPDVEVLIKEARRRRRRRRARAGAGLFALLGLGFGLGFGFFGNGGGGGGVVAGGGGRGGGARGLSSGASLNAAPVLASAPFGPARYQLSVQHAQIEVTPGSGWPGASCRWLSPRTLRVVSVARRCGGPSDLPRGVVVKGGPAGDTIRVMVRDPSTGMTKLGPALFTLDNWDWAHSGAVEGDGAYWIYELGPSGRRSSLIEVSDVAGTVIRRFRVPAAADPFMAVDADGLWITQSGYGGSSCAHSCTLWHAAPGSHRIVAERSLGARTQWLIASGHSIYADVLKPSRDYGFTQSIWRLDGAGARVAYRAPARLLPSVDFGIGTGYVVTGSPREGFFTLTELGRGRTPRQGGGCDTATPIRLIRIDPATGAQSYVATLPRRDAGVAPDCHLFSNQALLYRGAFYVLAGQSNDYPEYTRVVRLPT